jgi:acyl-CoA synthetase (NDP forming)
MTASKEELRPFFDPRSVAVVGASPIAQKVGNIIVHNLIENRERGLLKADLFPVNPKYPTILGQKCHPSLRDLPQDIETLVVVIPAEGVPRVIEEAASKNAKAAIVISSGFREVGNIELDDRLVKAGRETGIRIIGPNCLGIYDPYSGMDTLFLPEVKMLSSGREVVATPRTLPGHISLISQSGGFGVAALDYMAGSMMGVRTFVSLGNRCDVDEHELLDYFKQDEKTHVILLYVEGLKGGREFLAAARRFTISKPIVALKSGKTEAGARAAASHTAALAGVDKIYDGAFAQAGVVRAQTLEEFFDMGRALQYQKPAQGNRICILTNAGGPGIIAADTCIESGLRVDRLSETTLQKLEAMKAGGELLEIMTGANPLDLSGQGTSQMFAKVMRLVMDDTEVDGVIVMAFHQAPPILDDVVQAIAETHRGYARPILACDIGGTEMAEEFRTRFEKYGIPAYETPERAARAMYALAKYGQHIQSVKQSHQDQ